MGIFDIFTGAPDVAKKAADGIYNGLDKLFLTDEEQGDFWLKYLQATQPQNLARRYIALIVVGIWAMACLTIIISIFFAQQTTIDALISFSTVNIMPPTGVIISWYYWKRIKEK